MSARVQRLSSTTNDHARWMTRALALAARAEGRTHPNPMVGAVVVRGGRVIGEGFHARAGTAHAEVLALRAAGKRARGADLYVTLEPCAHHGRTPPCTDAIIKVGVRRVIYAMRDPNPQVSGRGLAQLRAAGVKIIGPILRADAERLNHIYLHWRRTRKPFVIAKVGATLDGCIADAHGTSQWITNDQVRHYAHTWRSRVDAILVGHTTVLCDDPHLTVRLPRYRGPQPIPCVWLGTGAIPTRSWLWRQTERSVWWIVSSPANARMARLASARGHRIVTAASLPQFLRICGRSAISALMIEGGGATLAHWWRAKAIDYAIVGLAPRILGNGVRWANQKGWRLATAARIIDPKIHTCDDNVIIEGRVRYGKK